MCWQGGEGSPRKGVVRQSSGDLERALEDKLLSIRRKRRDAQISVLQAELETLKMSALKRRAREVGVDAQALEDAEDSDSPKSDIIALIIAASPSSSSSDSSGRAAPSSERGQQPGEDARTPSSSRKMASGPDAPPRPGSSSPSSEQSVRPGSGPLTPLSREKSSGSDRPECKMAVGSLVRILKAGPLLGKCATVIAHEGYDEQFDADADPAEHANLDLLVEKENRVRVEIELTGEIATFPLSQIEPLDNDSNTQAEVEVEVALKLAGAEKLNRVLGLTPLQRTETQQTAEEKYRQAFRGFRRASDIESVDEIEVTTILSRGTSGTVSAARWRGMDVAVKQFHYFENKEEESEAVRQNFENEVFLMRELHHANLVRFFAAQSKPPNLCIVMERMAGSLTDLLYGRLRKNADKMLIAPRLVAVACGIVSGMAFLHAHNVCHRDLKSANVLFDKQLRIKICDFAFSKFKPSDENASMQLQTQIGTAAWMAPEVLRGDDYSLKCDSYSFGVIIWELIVRKQPFREFNHFQLLNHVGLQGKTLQMPDDAAPLWCAVASACWESQPQLRPSFAQLDTVFHSAAADLRDGRAKMHAGDRTTGAPIDGSEALLDDGAGMAAWRDVLSALRERVHEQHAGETERCVEAPAAALP